MELGGFPEPLFGGHRAKAERWSRLRLDRLAYEDTRDIKNLSDLNAFRVLLDLIPEKVGSLFSFNSLREDIGVAYATVRDWVLVSEALYYGFFVRPYSRRLTRALRAEPKFYLYDIVQIASEERSKRLENLAALHLLKACQYWTDSGQGLFDLHFVRDKEKREVDFLVTRERKPWMLIECKSNDKNPSRHLIYFAEALGTKLNFQLIDDSQSGGFDRLFPAQNIRVLDYEKFFAGWI
jgi:predicted AAA+ superfamily ATPase